MLKKIWLDASLKPCFSQPDVSLLTRLSVYVADKLVHIDVRAKLKDTTQACNQAWAEKAENKSDV